MEVHLPAGRMRSASHRQKDEDMAGALRVVDLQRCLHSERTKVQQVAQIRRKRDAK